MFVVGPKFKGIKMIPKGAHMIAYAARDSQGSYGIVTAFFFHVGGNDVLVRRYSPSTELLVPLEDEDEVRHMGS